MKKVLILLFIVIIVFSLTGCDWGLEIMGLEIEKLPNKLVYFTGVDTELDLGGGVVRFLLRDKDINSTCKMTNDWDVDVLHEIDFAKPGIYTVEIYRHDEARDQFLIHVVNPLESDIEKLQNYCNAKLPLLNEVKELLSQVEQKSLTMKAHHVDYIEPREMRYTAKYGNSEYVYFNDDLKDKLYTLTTDMELTKITKTGKIITFYFDYNTKSYALIYNLLYEGDYIKEIRLGREWYLVEKYH